MCFLTVDPETSPGSHKVTHMGLRSSAIDSERASCCINVITHPAGRSQVNIRLLGRAANSLELFRCH